MKKLVLVSAALGGAALIAFGAQGTFASFSDANSQKSAAGAGTLLLDTKNPSATESTAALSLNPGATASYAYAVQNNGSMNASLALTSDVTADRENGCAAQSEKDATWQVPAGLFGSRTVNDANCASANDAGEFSDFAQLTISTTTATTPEACTISATVATKLWTGDLADGPSTQKPLSVKDLLAPKGFSCVLVTVALPQNTGNQVQGDASDFKLNFQLSQK